MNVVIADDSRAMRMIVRKTIREAGYGHADIREAEDGAIALELIRTWSPDLLMTDWNMPNMGGLELLQALQKDGFGGASGVVSSAATVEMRSAANEAGARFVIQKPFTAHSFQQALMSVGFKPANGVISGGATKGAFTVNVDGIRGSLAGVYKRPLEISESEPMDVRNPGLSAFAVYELNGNAQGFVIMELPLAASLAGGLSLIPPARVEAAVKSGALEGELLGNLNEAFNLMCRATGAGGKAATLKKVEIGTEIPLFLRALSRKCRRCDVRITVPGYSAGRLCLAAK
ncbi:MAG: response regulator [Myxococcota bacterium]